MFFCLWETQRVLLKTFPHITYAKLLWGGQLKERVFQDLTSDIHPILHYSEHGHTWCVSNFLLDTLIPKCMLKYGTKC